MTAHNKISKTEAEEVLSEHFMASLASLPGSKGIVRIRDKCFATLLNDGLPTRRIESWHYTDLRRLLKGVPKAETFLPDAKIMPPLVEGAYILSLLNTVILDEFDFMPEGVSVSKFSDRLTDGSAKIYFEDVSSDDAIGQLNGAFVTDGYHIHIADEVQVDKPIELQFVRTGGQSHTRTPVILGQNSSVTIIERHASADTQDILASSVSHLKMEKGARARWIIIQNGGSDTSHLAQINIDMAENARLELYIINVGGQLVRQEIIAHIDGTRADLALRGVNLLAGDTHTDVTLKLSHNVSNTISTETFRNVVMDQARGVFQGQIKVAQEAQKTDAQMACNTLLLSDDADFSAKPELEIFADDVICAHGATVSDIDPAQLFYLMSRGVSETSARGLLVKGFVAEIIKELDDEKIMEALEKVITDWLKKHG